MFFWIKMRWPVTGRIPLQPPQSKCKVQSKMPFWRGNPYMRLLNMFEHSWLPLFTLMTVRSRADRLTQQLASKCHLNTFPQSTPVCQIQGLWRREFLDASLLFWQFQFPFNWELQAWTNKTCIFIQSFSFSIYKQSRSYFPYLPK